MSIWDLAGAAINAAFADPEQLIYTQAGVVLPPIAAIRIEAAAPSFDGSQSSLRTIQYEIEQGDLPAKPSNRDGFTHRGRRWRISNVDRLDDVGKWLVTASDDGAAA